jgi:hypothetical protein
MFLVFSKVKLRISSDSVAWMLNSMCYHTFSSCCDIHKNVDFRSSCSSAYVSENDHLIIVGAGTSVQHPTVADIKYLDIALDSLN